MNKEELEYLKSILVKNDCFERIKNEDIRWRLDHQIKGLLTGLKQLFPDNYVDKYKDGKYWIYTVYHGDKEFQKMMNTEIDFFTEADAKREMKNYLKQLN